VLPPEVAEEACEEVAEPEPESTTDDDDDIQAPPPEDCQTKRRTARLSLTHITKFQAEASPERKQKENFQNGGRQKRQDSKYGLRKPFNEEDKVKTEERIEKASRSKKKKLKKEKVIGER
jgi:hypothetical protein